jgi:UPF0755 protein
VTRVAGVLGLLGAVIVVTTAGGAAYLARQLEPAEPGSSEQVPFTVERGSGLRQIADALEAGGIIRSADAAVLVARLRDWGSSLKAGEYDLSPGQPTEDVLLELISGRVRTYTAVLPEGVRASEIARRLEEAGLADLDAFLRVVDDPEFARALGVPADNLEGYLYPETYEIPGDLSAQDVARILVEQFNDAWGELEPGVRDLALSKHEIVTLASIVEKETAAPEERPLIAAVFLNRLRKGMRLETDPTVIYGIPNFDGNLRKRHLQDASNPYNTYQIAGLPPGPIASPGADSLRAVVKPAETEYLYFVSRNDGTHEFSKTYREHLSAVNRYQRRGRRSSR